jgi:hypothetical protein
MTHGRLIAATATVGLAASTLLLTTPASATPKDKPENRGQAKTVSLTAQLDELNFSGATGTASATVRNQKIQNISVNASGLTPDAAHAIHIHYGEQAENECPTMAAATATRTDGTRRLTTTDGEPFYGPIVVSLTTSGDTTPNSALALDRFPVAMGGKLSYSRNDIEFTDVAGTGYGTTGTGTAKQIADAIRDGEGVVVVHGVDYNRNGMYDFASAGRSDLTPMAPGAPAEATDPALCGVLHHDH